MTSAKHGLAPRVEDATLGFEAVGFYFLLSCGLRSTWSGFRCHLRPGPGSKGGVSGIKNR